MLKRFKSLILPTVIALLTYLGGILLSAVLITANDFSVTRYRYFMLASACVSAMLLAALFGQKENAAYAILPLPLMMVLPVIIFRKISLFVPISIVLALVLYYLIMFFIKYAKGKKKTSMQKMRRNYERVYKK